MVGGGLVRVLVFAGEGGQVRVQGFGGGRPVEGAAAHNRSSSRV